MAGAIFFEIAIGMTMGLLAAVWRGSRVDQGLMVASFVFASTPQFLMGIVLLYVFAVHLHWFPMGGYGTLAQLVLPALTLGVLGAGWYSRMMRSSMIDVLRQDFIRTAKAKGIAPAAVVGVHALPNAILPIIALIGSDVGYFMSQTVVVESVFGWPGIGQLAFQAIQRIDIPIIMGVTVVTACAVVLGNLAGRPDRADDRPAHKAEVRSRGSSPDGAKRNPGLQRQAKRKPRISLTLHPGYESAMVRYRRNLVPGGMFFFTVTLADRRSRALVENIGALRAAFRRTRRERPSRLMPSWCCRTICTPL